MEFLQALYKAVFGGQHASLFLDKQNKAVSELLAKQQQAKSSLVKRNEAVNKAKLVVLEELTLQHAALNDEIKLLKGEK
jgi:hypothetical protein